MAEVTVDGLAQESGLPVSTIRLYQRRGLLDPPRRQGRSAFYNDAHRDRLRLIADLQARGYSLAAIGDLAERLGSGSQLDALLRLPAADDDLIDLTPAELGDRFAGTDLAAADVQRAGRLGLVTLVDDGRLRVRPAFLDAGTRLAAMGVPVARVLDEYEHLRATTADIADRFTALYAETIWPTGSGAALGALDELGPLAISLVDDLLIRALREAADRFAAGQTPDA